MLGSIVSGFKPFVFGGVATSLALLGLNLAATAQPQGGAGAPATRPTGQAAVAIENPPDANHVLIGTVTVYTDSGKEKLEAWSNLTYAGEQSLAGHRFLVFRSGTSRNILFEPGKIVTITATK